MSGSLIASTPSRRYSKRIPPEISPPEVVILCMTPVTESGCWIWDRATGRDGYGRIRRGGEWSTSHRFSFEAFNGPVPEGLSVLHKCDVRPCVNPDHLYAGTQSQNMRDTWSRSRNENQFSSRSHCSKGHEYVGGSYFLDAKGARCCKACKRENTRRWRSKNAK